MKKVLISGGKGDIAVSLIKKLKEKGEYEIFAPSHSEMDVTDIDSVSKYVKSIGGADILVNNAGINVDTNILTSDIKVEKNILDTNLFGIFNCASAVLKINTKALVLNIGSMSGTAAGPTYNSYRVAKAGVIMATQCWAKQGVNTFCINVGRLEGAMRRKLFPDGDPFADTLLKQERLAAFIEKLIAKSSDVESGKCFCVHSDNVDDLINNM